MSIYSTIYKCTNIITNECYIGFDSNWPSRKVKHLYDVSNTNSKNYNCHFYRAIRKYGIESFCWNIIYQSKDKEHCLNEMESHFINEFDSFNNGYNMTKGGEGTLGKKSWLGRKHSIETIKKMKEVAKKRGISDVTRAAQKLAVTGKKRAPFTNETRAKMSEASKIREQRKRMLRAS